MISPNIPSARANDALNYALSYSQSGIRNFASQYEKFKSDIFLTHLATQLTASANIKQPLDRISEALFGVCSDIIRPDSISISIHGSLSKKELIDAHIRMLIQSIINQFPNPKHNQAKEVVKQFESQYMQNYFKIPIDVHHCVESYKIPIYTHPDFANIAIAGYLMNYVFLHPLIREKGGAYGSGSNVNESGVFSFYSYRDPHIKNTYQAFADSLSQVINGQFNENDIKEAKLLAFSKIDKPLAQSDEGMLIFTRNYTNLERQLFRERLLDASKDSIIESANKYLFKERSESRASRVVVGQEDPKMEEIKGWECMTPLAFIAKSN